VRELSRHTPCEKKKRGHGFSHLVDPIQEKQPCLIAGRDSVFQLNRPDELGQGKPPPRQIRVRWSFKIQLPVLPAVPREQPHQAGLFHLSRTPDGQWLSELVCASRIPMEKVCFHRIPEFCDWPKQARCKARKVRVRLPVFASPAGFENWG